MRANGRMTAWLTEQVRVQLDRARLGLGDGQRGAEVARNAMVKAISMAEAAGAPADDVEVLRAAKEAIDGSAVEQLRELEARVSLLCERAKGG